MDYILLAFLLIIIVLFIIIFIYYNANMSKQKNIGALTIKNGE